METVKKKDNRGGARPGAGRPKGSTQAFTIESLLATVEKKAQGQSYEEILIEDFLAARTSDRALAQKYHNLILNKVAPSLQKVETSESEDAVQSRAEAFAEALTTLATMGKK
jgi:hypothetical protein